MSDFDKNRNLNQAGQGSTREDVASSAEDAKREAREVAQDAKHKAQETAEDVKHKAQEAAQEVKADVQEAASEVAEDVLELASETRAHLVAALSENKTRAADELHSVAAAFKETGQNLRNHDEAAIARYADQLGIQVDRVSGYLRERDLGSMLSDLESFARREPGLFIGGAVAVGLLATRFLKSSGHHAGSDVGGTTGSAMAGATHRQVSGMSVPAGTAAGTAGTTGSPMGSTTSPTGQTKQPYGSGRPTEEE